MTLRMDHMGVVVSDLDAAKAFFVELGMEPQDEAAVEGEWVDRINAIDGLQVDIVMMRTPDGSGMLELTAFRSPQATSAGRESDPTALGYRSIMFEVDDIEDTVERLRRHCGSLVGEIVDYADVYRLCYLRGPDGVIVSLAQQIG